MSDAANMRERHQAGLVELADLGLSLARDLHARALAADDDESANGDDGPADEVPEVVIWKSSG